MKVLHVTPWYEPAWGTGGTATAVSNLCRALVKEGVKVTVYTTNDAGEGHTLDVPLGSPQDVGGVEVWYFPCDFWFKRKRAFSSKSLCLKVKETIAYFDLVHISSIRNWIEVKTAEEARRAGIPYVVSPHAGLMRWWVKEIGYPLPKTIYMKFIENTVLRRAAAIHFLSETERIESSPYLPRSLWSFIVPNGVNIQHFRKRPGIRAKLRSKYGVPQNAVVLLHVGRIHPQKNIHLVIEALALLREPDLYYFIVGSIYDKGYYNAIIKRITTHGLNANVHFVGSVPSSKVRLFYAFADLLVMLSKVEGLSMSIIESLACSLPVIASNRVANAQEILNYGAGAVIRPNVNELAESISTILSNKRILKEMSNNASQMVKHEYDIVKVASLMKQAYLDILSGDKSASLKWKYA